MSLFAEIQKKTKEKKQSQQTEQDKFIITKINEFLPRIEEELYKAANDGKSTVTITFTYESLRYPDTNPVDVLYKIIQMLMKKDAPLECFSRIIGYNNNSAILQLYLSWGDNQIPTLHTQDQSPIE